MAHVVIRSGGKQFVVEEGKQVRVPSVAGEAGSAVELEALLVAGKETALGAAAGAVKVAATIVEQGRDSKVVIFKKKRRKHYKRKQGHRQGYTTLKIDSIG